ncbi:uncharacterized protein LOC111291602, partial [Durio zibethinus]|uniref:Uncharacterized protein LOC111291602 n=1 Tax=Durio zibethinus TaxID=66656 RepID=A0A6P5YFI1_DURZI
MEDAIKDALRIDFKVDFAMHHLKRIARAYFGCMGNQELQSIEYKLDALNKQRAETYKDFKDCLADAKDFYGKSVSTGYGRYQNNSTVYSPCRTVFYVPSEFIQDGTYNRLSPRIQQSGLLSELLRMHPQVAQSEASNQQHRRFFQRRKNKRKNNALNRQKKKKEYARVAAENRHLTGIIEGMISQYLKVQGKNFQKHENYVSHLASENDHRSFYAQLDVMNGLALNELDNPLSNEVKNPKNSQTIQKSTMSEFLKKIDDDVASSNDFSDFMVCFDGEHKKIGRYSFPLSLVSTVERITNVYGD